MPTVYAFSRYLRILGHLVVIQEEPISYLHLISEQTSIRTWNNYWNGVCKTNEWPPRLSLGFRSGV